MSSTAERRADNNSIALFSTDTPFISDTANITRLTMNPVDASRLNIFIRKSIFCAKNLFFINLYILSPVRELLFFLNDNITQNTKYVLCAEMPEIIC